MNKSVLEWFESANSKWKLQDYHGAIADQTKAISLNPDYAEAYNGRGLAKGKLEDAHGAIADFTKAVILKPNYADAYVGIGLSCLLLRQKSKALENFNRAIEQGSRVPQQFLDMCK